MLEIHLKSVSFIVKLNLDSVRLCELSRLNQISDTVQVNSSGNTFWRVWSGSNPVWQSARHSSGVDAPTNWAMSSIALYISLS